MEEKLNKLELEVQKVNAKLVAQEHRLIPSLVNLYRAVFVTKVDRQESFTAVAWNLFARTPAAVTISLAGLLGAYLAYQANQILESQNSLIKTQNQLTLNQNRLAEAARRSNLIPELTRVFDEISEESKTRFKDGAKIKLTPVLEGRIIALSKGFRPYYFLDYKDSLTKNELSPERGQLLLGLTESNVDLSYISKKADFTWALLQQVKIDQKDFLECNMSYTKGDGSFFDQCDFSSANYGEQDSRDLILLSANCRVKKCVLLIFLEPGSSNPILLM